MLIPFIICICSFRNISSFIWIWPIATYPSLFAMLCLGLYIAHITSPLKFTRYKSIFSLFSLYYYILQKISTCFPNKCTYINMKFVHFYLFAKCIHLITQFFWYLVEWLSYRFLRQDRIRLHNVALFRQKMSFLHPVWWNDMLFLWVIH